MEAYLKVNIFLLCYNEEVLLPHTIRHYRKYLPSATFTIFDNKSTDRSVEMAKSLGLNVFSFDSNLEIDDFKYLKIKNNCWKAITEGWVIVCDMDEWLCIDEEWLEKEEELGTTIISTEGYEIVGDSQEENLSDINPHSLCHGVRSAFLDKKICFRASEIKEINYQVGSHSCSPQGIIKINGPYLLKHMKMLGLPYALKQNKIRYERSSRMRSIGLAVHYSTDSDVIRNFKDGWVNQNTNIRHLCECFEDNMKINENGYWETYNSFGHVHDEKLAIYLSNFFKQENIKSLVDFGCGLGDYVKIFNSNGIYCEAFDGNPNTEMLTNGLGKVLDLSHSFDLSRKYDCVLSLEVGEHIPKKYEQIFLDNLSKHSENMIVISWAIVGQEGHGHVNCQNNEYIIGQMKERKFIYDKINSELLRKQWSEAFWFGNTLMVFRKN